MKRLFAIALAAVMLAALAVVPASAANDFSVDITNTETELVVGSTVDIIFEIDDVVGELPLANIMFEIHYDYDYIEGTYTQTNLNDTSALVETPSGADWETIITNQKDGVFLGYYEVSLMPSDMGIVGTEPSPDCLNAGEALSIKLPFTVLPAAAGQEINIEIKNVKGVDARDYNYATIVEGGTDVFTATGVEVKLPVTTLGAKINTERCALRLGAKYEKAYLDAMDVNSVTDLGLVFYPTRLLGDAELTLATEGAAKVSAVAIEEFDAAKTFVDYDSFTFYVTIVEIPVNGLDDEISFRAYITDGTDTVYATDTIARSYEYVYNITYPSIGSGSGDNTIYPGTGWFE